MQGQPPGWYPTNEPSTEQWWDGDQWSGRLRAVPAQPAPEKKRRLSGVARVLATAALSLVAVVLFAVIYATVQSPSQQETCLYAQSRANAGFDPAEGLDVSDC